MTTVTFTLDRFPFVAVDSAVAAEQLRAMVAERTGQPVEVVAMFHVEHDGGDA